MPQDLRRNNLGAVVRHLHLHGPLSRSELTAHTGLNRSTVGHLVGELAQAGLVKESAPLARAGIGRPSLVVKLEVERVSVLAVEIATDALVVARVGPGGHVQERLVQPHDWRTPLDVAGAVATVKRLGRSLISRAPEDGRLVGAAVAVPGIVRRLDGFVHLAPNLGWHDVPLGSLLAEQLPILPRVLVANEADLGVLAECVRGAAIGCRNVIYISGNAGVGAGIVVDSAVLEGRSGYAGEVGHMKVNPAGLLCRCGGRGCWESEIGAAAILRRAGRQAIDVRGGVAGVLEDARSGNRKAALAVRRTGEWIGCGAANLVNLFNPELLVLGGVISRVFLAGEAVVIDELNRQTLPQAGSDVAVVVAGLATDSVIVGAAELALSQFLDDPMMVLGTQKKR